MAAFPPRMIRAARETCLCPVLKVVLIVVNCIPAVSFKNGRRGTQRTEGERKVDKTYGGQDYLQLAGVVHHPRNLGLQSNVGTVGAAALVADAESRGRTPGHRDQV